MTTISTAEIETFVSNGAKIVADIKAINLGEVEKAHATRHFQDLLAAGLSVGEAALKIGGIFFPPLLYVENAVEVGNAIYGFVAEYGGTFRPDIAALQYDPKTGQFLRGPFGEGK